MDAATRNLVRDRARRCCEYCRLRQSIVPLVPFHTEHIIARQHGGTDDLSNLAFSCHHCNLHKGPNLAGIDPDTGEMVALYNPRRDTWAENFEVRNLIIVGLSPTGRATARVLAMNSASQLDLRSASME